MDKLSQYKHILEEEFKHHAKKRISNAPDTNMHLFIGENKNHFILMNIGWQGKRYHHAIFFNVEIINDKVWIHEDNTDMDLIGNLLKKGIPKEDMVLGFVPSYVRGLEGFAVG